MTQLPVPDMGLLMGAYGELGASQGRAKQRQQNYDNALAAEDRILRRQVAEQRAMEEAAKLRQQHERQMRDAALQMSRLYSDNAYRQSLVQRPEQQYAAAAQRDASNVLNEQLNKRLQFGAQSNLSDEARAAHNQQVGKLQAIMRARSRSSRPWQYDDALAQWVAEYDALGIPAQVRPDAQPQMVPIQGPDGEVYGIGFVDPSTGQITRTMPKPKPDKVEEPPFDPFAGEQPVSAEEAFRRSPELRDSYYKRATDYHSRFGETDENGKAKPVSPSQIVATAKDLYTEEAKALYGSKPRSTAKPDTSFTPPLTSSPVTDYGRTIASGGFQTTSAPPPPPSQPSGQFTPQQAAVIEQAKQAAANGDQQAIEFLQARGLL